MTIRRRRRLDPVPHEPSHRRLWRSWWRRCSCGLPAPCVDRLVPAPRLPFPPVQDERSAPVTDPQPGGETEGIGTPNVALRHVSSDSRPEVAGNVAAESKSPGVTTPPVPRTAAQIDGFFDGLLLIQPALVSPARWRPEPDVDPEEDTRWMCAGVARLSAR
jgi:hypothetical protein